MTFAFSLLGQKMATEMSLTTANKMNTNFCIAGICGNWDSDRLQQLYKEFNFTVLHSSYRGKWKIIYKIDIFHDHLPQLNNNPLLTVESYYG